MRDGIDVRRVIRIGIAGLVVLAVVVAGAVLLTSRWDNDRPSGTAASPRSWISGPVLESRPRTDMAQYLAGKQKLTDSYGWVDRQAGIARIPLDAAMRAIVEGVRP
jgi:hypothetical protein